MRNSKRETIKKSFVIPLPRVTFKKRNKGEKFFSRPTISSAQVLIDGKLVVFIFCSLVSAFINLVFISNLTKSDYTIGTLLSIPAAVVLGSLSLGLDLAKFLLAIQVNTLNELVRKLSKFEWVKRVKRAAAWWRSIYIVFILLSVVTSVSLSTISIGAGISRNANMISQIDEYIVQGEQYTNINAAAGDVTRQNLINRATDTSERDAREYADNAVSLIEEFQIKITPILKDETLDDDERKAKLAAYESDRTKINNILKGAGYRARSFKELSEFNTLTIATDIKQKRLEYLKSNSNDIAVEKLGELTDNTNQEILSWLETLNSLNLINPKTGEQVIFSTDENKAATVLAKSALTLLKSLRVDVENDSGDIGSSSKLFMQLGGAWDARHIGDKDLQAALNVKTDGSFGSTEIMMMGMLLFLSLLCELAINLFSPKTNISRKMLSQFSEYFSPDFDINDFMLDIYLDQIYFGTLPRDIFDRKARKAVELKYLTKEMLYIMYGQKDDKEKTEEETEKLIEEKMKELDSIIKTREMRREINEAN